MRHRLERFILKTWQTRGLISTLLLPLAFIYKLISGYNANKKSKSAWHCQVPVIVVGNIMIGGTGKTPVTVAICQYLQSKGWQIGVISRGYRATIKNKAHLSADDADSTYLGDEPALIHQTTGLPVAAHPQRIKAAQALLARHPETNLIIADDGLQHLALARDIEILVQDQRGTGNGRLIPAGPLREPATRLNHVDYIVNNNVKPSRINSTQVFMQLEIHHLEHLATQKIYSLQQWQQQHQNQEITAIAGIGQPDRFFTMLQNNNIQLDQTIALGDHQAISPDLLGRLDPQTILVTSKDAIKYSRPYDARIWVVHAQAQFSQNDWLEQIHQRLLALQQTKKQQANK